MIVVGEYFVGGFVFFFFVFYLDDFYGFIFFKGWEDNFVEFDVFFIDF